MRISADELAKVDRDSIPLGNGGGYYGEMAVFHELHCLVRGSLLIGYEEASSKHFTEIHQASISYGLL
jgi:hypothetical protein